MITADVTGGDELADAFDGLAGIDKSLAKRNIRKKLRERMAPLRELARGAAPYRSGRLYRSIKIKAWTRAAKGETGVKLIIDRGKSRQDKSGAYYGWMIEFGRLAGNRYIPGRYMIRNAYETSGEPIAAEAAKDVEAVVQDVLEHPKSDKQRRYLKYGLKLSKYGPKGAS